MPDKFDRYRESLVIETVTDWPADCSVADPAKREEIQQKLHADASACAQLEYIRLSTGFCRKITVTADDIERAK